MSTIDKVRYNQYYLIPSIQVFVNSKNKLKRNIIDSLISSSLVGTRSIENHEEFILNTMGVFLSTDNFIIKCLCKDFDEVISKYIRALLKNKTISISKVEESYKVRGSKIRNIHYMDLMGFLDDMDIKNDFIKHVSLIIEPKVLKELDIAIDIVKKRRIKRRVIFMNSWSTIKELSTGKLITSTSIWIFLVPAITKMGNVTEEYMNSVFSISIVSSFSLLCLYFSAIAFFYHR